MNKQIKKDLKHIYRKKKKRYRHVMGVLEVALQLAKRYDVDEDKVTTAVLLHDITKYMSKKKHKKLIKSGFDDADKILSSFNKNLYHAFSATVYATKEYGVTDPDILMAVMHHTIGRPNMSKIEEIVFISDYIEPNRTYQSCIEARDIVLEENKLPCGIYKAMNDTIMHNESRHKEVPKLAYLARTFYKEECDNFEKN